MEFSTAYLTPPYPASGYYRGPVTPPTVRPRSSGDTTRWHPYTSRFRSSTPTAGLRPSRSSESVPSSSRHVWPQPTKSHYLYPGYEPSYSERQYSPPARRSGATAYYITPDPSPPSVRSSHKYSYSVPPTIDRDLAAFRPALPPTPPRSRTASVEFEGAAPIPFCSIDAPHASSLFVQQAYDLLMSIYYHSSPPPSPVSSHAPNLAMYMPIPGSLPIDPPPLHWFTAELIRRASVSTSVLKLAISYIVRARSAARRACEACSQAQSPISPPPSPPYPVPPQLDGGNIMYTRRRPNNISATELSDPRQMLLAALVLAQKFLVDAAYTSATWGRLSGLATADVAAVERALGSALDWRLWEKNM
ncbi:hypothetical protein FS749_005178 [Ceratobasidium sp. UAMH 11750]|nr:hypothetical protein FS749_005178 [Ceratobasidium sp. UAMH 11750]